MNVKPTIALLVLFVFLCYSCTKSSNSTTVTTTSTAANIDTIKGYYQGTTSGDSLYTYTDSTGKPQQWLRSFGWTDTLVVTSSDTASITVSSKYYTITFPYGDSLTASSITNLQKQTLNERGFATYNTTLTDTANGINHLVINIWYNYTKHITSSVILYKKQ